MVVNSVVIGATRFALGVGFDLWLLRGLLLKLLLVWV